MLLDTAALAQRQAGGADAGLHEPPPSDSPTGLDTPLEASPLRRQGGRSLQLPPLHSAARPATAARCSSPVDGVKALQRPHTAPAGGWTPAGGGPEARPGSRLSALQRLKSRTVERQAAVLASGASLHRCAARHGFRAFSL